MKVYPLCAPYFWEDARVLANNWLFLPQHQAGTCVSELVNHVIWMYLLAAVLGGAATMVTHSSLALPLALVAAVVWTLPAIWALMYKKEQREGFQSGELRKVRGGPKDVQIDQTPRPTGTSEDATEMYDVIGAGAAPAVTLPTVRNPFMNVLLDEIKYHPTRPMAASIYDPSVKVSLDDFFRAGFYNDPTDVFGRSQSQRQFIAMPSTSIPNDQKSYQEWLYKIPGKTCKEGGREACLPGTDGGALPWMNVNK
jgi:hypothetical protein